MKCLARLIVLMISFSAQPLLAEPLRVFAAASMQGVLEDIAAQYDGPVRISYGGSGAMARQVASGAPADVVILADAQWSTWMNDHPRVPVLASEVVTANRLVLISYDVKAVFLEDTPALSFANHRIAMGQREAVPAGRYAKDWLQNISVWDAVQPNLIETDNVRSALALVASRAAPWGVVYASDAQAEPRVNATYLVPQQFHDPVLYPALAITKKGMGFVAFLTSDFAQNTFKARGFSEPSP